MSKKCFGAVLNFLILLIFFETLQEAVEHFNAD
jgi:hypothetical protein